MAKSGATVPNPTHDLTLSDGVNTVGLMLSDKQGKLKHTAIQRTPYPRQSTKISTTNNQYSDLEPPYYAIDQSDWSGGRGSLTFEDDKTRFLDSYRAWTDQAKQVIIGGQETYCTTPRSCNQNMPGNLIWQKLESDIYLAYKFSPSADYTAAGAMLWVKYTGTPTNLIVEIWTDNAGSPNAVIAGLTSTLAYTSMDSVTSQLRYFAFTTPTTLTGGTSYWVVARVAADSEWYIGTNSGAASLTKHSADGSSWDANAHEMYYRVVDQRDAEYKFFEYKRALYAVSVRSFMINKTREEPSIYINGDRGAADSNAADLTYLVDATKTWTNDEWIGCKVLVTKGTGSQESQPWRNITDNNGTTLTVSPDWEIAHDTTTEYVILGSNKWTEKYAFSTSNLITDVAVADETVYFARADATIYSYIEQNLSGTWTVSTNDEKLYADRILAISRPDGWELWGGMNNDGKHKTTAWVAKIPPPSANTSDKVARQYLHTRLSELVSTESTWNEQAITYVAQAIDDDDLKISVAAAFTTGVLCTKAIPPTDISEATKVGLLIKPDVACAAQDLRLLLDDTPFCLHHYVPDNMWQYDTEVMPSKLTRFRSAGRPTYIYNYDADGTPDKWHLEYNGRDYPATAASFKTALTATDDYLYISFDQPMTAIYFDLTTPFNTADDSHVSAEYWNGKAWTAISGLSDGTLTGSHPTDRSFGQDGWITWTMPVDWSPGCEIDSTSGQATYLPMDNWHIRLKISVTTSEITFTEITCLGTGYTEYPETERWVEMGNAKDDNNANYPHSFTFYDNSSIYVGYSKRFNRIKVSMAGTAVNAIDSHFHGYYWNGQGWVEVASLSDGTTDSSHALGKSGDITFTMPTLWEKGCHPWEQTALGEDIYLIRLVLDVTEAANYSTTANIQIKTVTLEDDSLIETFRYTPLTRAKDGDTGTYDYITLTTDDWVYVMYQDKFNKVIWDVDTTVNTATASMTAQYFDGSIWKTLTLSSDGTSASSKTLAQDGEMVFVIPNDWMAVSIEGSEGYAVRLAPSADLTQVKVVGVEVGRDHAMVLSLPALTVNQWQYVELSITPFAVGAQYPDPQKIVSVGLQLATNWAGAQVVRLHGGVWLLKDAPTYIPLGNADENITAIEAYGDERENPWYFTDGNVWEVQTQNDNTPVPVPLREIRSLRSETNGQAHTVSNVYLVFNLGQHIEKYYQHNLDDIGPDRDEGLPGDRRGYPITMLSYPSRIITAIDSGDIPTSGWSMSEASFFSSVLARRESGWHEMYRAPNGMRMRDIRFQVIPGMIDRLWISHGSDILWIPMPDSSFNPVNDSNFRYTHEATVITGWYTLSFLDVEKYYDTIKVYSENLSGTNQYIAVDYQLETGTLSSGWTEISDTFDTSPIQENKLSSGYDVNGRRIRFRYRLYTTSSLETPIMRATVLEALMRFPIKYVYTTSVILSDFPVDSKGSKDKDQRVEDALAILEAWADSPTVLTMRCPFSAYDNVKVVLEDAGMKPIEVDPQNQYEKHIGTMSLLGV